MSDEAVTWVETTREVYAAIYKQHFPDFGVFGTISRSEDDWYGERHMMTEWGFRNAAHPLIKHDERGTPGEHRYYIASVKETPNAS